MNRWFLIGILMFAACVHVKPVTVIQASHSSLATAQDVEAQLCWGAPDVRSGPEDRSVCTAPSAASVGLTKERHQALNRAFVRAFGLERAAISAGFATADYTTLNGVIAEILTIVGQLQSNTLVSQLKTAVNAAQVKQP